MLKPLGEVLWGTGYLHSIKVSLHRLYIIGLAKRFIRGSRNILMENRMNFLTNQVITVESSVRQDLIKGSKLDS